MNASTSETLQLLSPELRYDNISLGLQQAYEIAKSRTPYKDVSTVNFFAGKMKHSFGIFKSASLDLSVTATNGGPAFGMLRGGIEDDTPRYYSTDQVTKIEEELKNAGFQVNHDTKTILGGQNIVINNDNTKTMLLFGYSDRQSAQAAYGGKDIPNQTDETKRISVISYPESDSPATEIYNREGIPNSQNTEHLVGLVNSTLDTMAKVMNIVSNVIEPRPKETTTLKPKIVNWVGSNIDGPSTLSESHSVINNDHVVGVILD